ncbi:phage gp6-like head-tail connector protein [Agrobacterium tumefaciens]|uniref:head-tail connector protein n=1 Tax=Agrobacterium tumefaciens TaxID=358 RepID=UPI0015724EBF|nr:head-tail connector protein [Agrobacterium tumefaciens]NTA48151.1 phage gp6-like head-tail connector protein [Agrobacterium tumefaciens]
MAIVDLETVKKHLRVFHEDEDTEIGLYRDAAESIVTQHLDREVVAAGETPTAADGIAATPAIVSAILLVTGDLYEVREPDPNAAGDAVLPRAVRMLLAPWRVWRTVADDYVAPIP